MNFRKFLLCLPLLVISFALSADEEQHALILESIRQLIPDFEVDSIQKSPIEGLYQVMIGTGLFYVTEDGRYILEGELYDIKDKRNVSETEKEKVRAIELAELNEENLIVFASEQYNPDLVLYVFTDISCGYCRKLHKDVPDLNKMGVTVKYLAYPRAGVNSNAGFELAAVWCADNRNDAMNEAKAGEIINDVKECGDPVKEHFELGNRIGVTGTPAIFLKNGRKLPGYRPPMELLELVSNS